MDTIDLAPVIIDGIPVFPCVFQAEPEAYFVQEGDNWIKYSEKNLRLRLRESGLSNRVAPGADVSQVENALIRIQQSRRVHYAQPLAGWKSGLLHFGRASVCVTESTRPTIAEDVPWPNLEKYLTQLLGKKALPHQIGWWQWGRKSLFGNQVLPGQCPVYVGPAGCGKSLLQSLSTKLFGGRSTSAYSYMVGNDFNSELFESEHLVIEDQFHDKGSKKYQFAAKLKELTVNHVQRCHKKNCPAFTTTPKWRVSMSMNGDGMGLQVLPEFDESLLDKLMLFVCDYPTFPTDLGTTDGWKEWERIMDAELPGLAYHIDNYDLGDLAMKRYGVKPWHDKSLIQESGETTKEAVFRECIVHDLPLAMDEDQTVWEGTALQLERILRGDNMPSKRLIEKTLTWSTACGILLAKIASQYPEAVDIKMGHRKTKNYRIDLEKLGD